MGNRLARLGLILGMLAGSRIADGAPPPDYFLAVAVRPITLVRHEVDVKGPFDQTRAETLLVGPSYSCHVVGVGSRPVAQQGASFNWYGIERPTEEPERRLSVVCSLTGDEPSKVVTGEAVCLLSPSKRLTTGRPSDASDRLNYYKGYRIVDAKPDVRREIEIRLESGPQPHELTKAAVLCVPVEEWHHHEHFPIVEEGTCLMLYEVFPRSRTSIKTVDQFGLNKLERSARRYLLAPAKIVHPQDHSKPERVPRRQNRGQTSD